MTKSIGSLVEKRWSSWAARELLVDGRRRSTQRCFSTNRWGAACGGASSATCGVAWPGEADGSLAMGSCIRTRLSRCGCMAGSLWLSRLLRSSEALPDDPKTRRLRLPCRNHPPRQQSVIQSVFNQYSNQFQPTSSAVTGKFSTSRPLPRRRRGTINPSPLSISAGADAAVFESTRRAHEPSNPLTLSPASCSSCSSPIPL